MIAIPTRFEEFGFPASRSALTCALLNKKIMLNLFLYTICVCVVFLLARHCLSWNIFI